LSLLYKQGSPKLFLSIFPSATYGRYTQQNKIPLEPFTIDITQDCLVCSTHKSISEPSGSWGITLVHRKDKNHPWGQTWYDKIRPMDMAIIQMSRYAISSDSAPKVMVGLVDNVRISVSLDQDGAPQRQIVINGRDFGEILETTQIWYNYDVSQSLLAASFVNSLAFSFEHSTPQNNLLNLPFNLTPGNLIGAIVSSVVNTRMQSIMRRNPAIEKIAQKSFFTDNQGAVHPTTGFGTDIFDTSQFLLTFQGGQNFVGSAHDMLSQYQNSPWCEMYVDPLVPLLHVRWAPLMDETGNIPIVGSQQYVNYQVGSYEIDPTDIISMDVGFSSNEIYNFFVTYMQNVSFDGALNVASGYFDNEESGTDIINDLTTGLGNPGWVTSKIDEFGLLILEANTTWLSPDAVSAVTQSDMAKGLNTWLVEVFGHNDQLQNGTIVLKGDPNIQIGKYAHVLGWEATSQGGDTMKSQYFYIESVDHTFQQLQGYTTQLGVTRGQEIGNIAVQPGITGITPGNGGPEPILSPQISSAGMSSSTWTGSPNPLLGNGS